MPSKPAHAHSTVLAPHPPAEHEKTGATMGVLLGGFDCNIYRSLPLIYCLFTVARFRGGTHRQPDVIIGEKSGQSDRSGVAGASAGSGGNFPALALFWVLDNWLGVVGNWEETGALELIGGVSVPFYSKSLPFNATAPIPGAGIQACSRTLTQGLPCIPAPAGRFNRSQFSSRVQIWFAIFESRRDGEVNDVAQDATAYAHRDTCSCKRMRSLSNTTTAFVPGISDTITNAMLGVPFSAYAGYFDPQVGAAPSANGTQLGPLQRPPRGYGVLAILVGAAAQRKRASVACVLDDSVSISRRDATCQRFPSRDRVKRRLPHPTTALHSNFIPEFGLIASRLQAFMKPREEAMVWRWFSTGGNPLPQEDDSLLSSQQQLLNHISNCADSFCDGLRDDGVASEVQDRWGRLRQTLAHFASIHGSPHISREFLNRIITRMRPDAAQNAGVVLRRREADLTMEFFQASPTNAAVTGTTGKLVIQFPSRPRLSLPIQDASVQSLSALLAALDCTKMEDAIPKTQKAGSGHDETRDVPDIRYVSELLGGIARALTPAESAEDTASSTVYATKRINDHVLWKSALLPWRRSPKWLVIRAALQTTVEDWGIPEQYGYKVFITFILAKTLKLALAADVSHDLLFVMSAKIGTRMWKLRSVFSSDPSPPPFPLDFVASQINATHSIVADAWEAVQAREALKSSWVAPSPDQITAAQTLTLPRSSAHFEAVKVRGSALQSMVFQTSEFEEHLRSQCEAQKQTPPSPGQSTPDLWLQFLDLEQRVADWTDSSSLQPLTMLADLIEEHDQLAISFKSRNPEIFSRIFLVVLELWVALDKSATSQFPLLLDYSPELSVRSFEPLLLPELSQMRRLRNVELYVAKRHTNATYPDLSVFSFNPHRNSLPSRHFTGDADLQTLREDIQRQASSDRAEKIQELQSKSRLHATILEQRDQLETLYFTDRWGNYKHDWWYCRRCAKKKEADRMTITIFEWPLPGVDAFSRLVVFELSLPTAFGIWRDATYILARNHSNIEAERSPPSGLLRDYSLLKANFASKNPKQRVTIASTASSFLQAHYGEAQHFPWSESSIIKNNPLRYRLWDTIAGEWLPSTFLLIDIRDSCTLQIPSGPYKCLTWTMVSTAHAPNDVIARQSECPAELSYHEWEAFGHLRAGVRLQWHNIMLQIIAGVIDLADPAVYLLFRQAAWQAETALDDRELRHYRDSHFDLSRKDFGVEIVNALWKRLDSISENWKEGWTAATLGVIACRLFSLTHFEGVQTKVLAFLSSLRQTLFQWMKQVLALLASLSSVTQEEARADLLNRVLQLAASCRSTYAIGSLGLRVIFHDAAAASNFIQCGITLHTYTPSEMYNLPPALRYSLERDTIVSAEALAPLTAAILQSGDGLDHAVRDVWQGFHRDRQIRYVHVNLVDGSFLVDGKAQATIPNEIAEHPFFAILFPNQSSLDIVPSTMRGMDYQSRDNMDDLEVHFNLTGDNLLIRTHDGLNSSEFIAPKYLKGDIPTDLLDGMVHIFHEESQCMDIYPAGSEPSGWRPLTRAAWRLNLLPDGPQTLSKITDDNMAETVLDPAGSLLEGLANIFRPLEANRTNLTVYSRSGRLRISLPRYNLEFYVGLGGLLESKELPDFFVSPTQSIGTLIGLKSKLVLKSLKSEMTKVFIPEGTVSISCAGRADSHPTVTISPFPIDNHIKVFSYDIDDIIGRVVGDGSLTSWYRLAYLHFVTSSHLRDPLLHRTGIQQGQEMLGSTQSFAFIELNEEHNSLLQQIMDLAPIRNYYPSCLTSMETVGWHESLSPIVQCGRFVPLVDAIVNYVRKQAVFDPPERETTITAAYRGSLSSWMRAECRLSRLVSNVQIDECDQVIAPSIRCLDSPESSAKQQVVAETAALVRQWPPFVDITDGLWAHFESWCSFSSKPVADDTINNPRVWLQDPPSEAWFRLFHLSRALVKDRDQYGLIVALGILAYHSDEVLKHVEQNCLSFDEVSETLFGLTQRSRETPEAWANRRRGAFHSQKQTQCETVAGRIFDHWPLPGSNLTTIPGMASILLGSLSANYPLVKFAKLRTEMETLFTIKLRNRRMFESVERFQEALNTVPGSPQIEPFASLPSSTSISTVAVNPPKYVSLTLRSLLERRDLTESRHASASRRLISRLEGMTIDGPKSRYIADLSRCVDALEGRDSDHSGLEARIQNVLGPATLLERLLYQTGQWPSIGPESLVCQLSRETWQVLPESWRITLTQFAEVLAVKQQRRRIAVLSEPGFEGELAREVGTRCGQGWDPLAYPDWLLVQLDADLLIRPIQANIAEKMMGRGIEDNSLIQLNMGEGKSSVTVPIASAALADGQQLVRVVVLKPLSAQMFQLLKQRVCGLANRRLFYFPFSRDIQLDCHKIQQIVALFKECARVGGILLCQPEHILSFQLMGLHALCQTEGAEEPQLLMEAQDWLDSTARDILDESDEILNVRYQLIYTLGAASPPEGRPWRWSITQSVFSLLEKHAKTVPDGLEIVTFSEAHRFPVTRILTLNGRQALLESIVREIVFKDGLQEWISFRTCTSGEKEIFAHFIRELEIAPEDARSVQTFSDTNHFGQLLLLRGLFAHGILSLALQQKRWRVDYGLDLGRSMLAVPYRAKDSPAARAEFGHPDTIIVLTCLSYYYGGLRDDQLNTAFKFLLNSDNPEAQYEHWVQGIDGLPANLANLRGLNLEDFEQRTTSIFPILRYNKAAIDFYLSECVFPKEAREFSYKLTTNAWDLARTKTRLVTGFSGTNDNKHLLPLSIAQLDEDSQRHTNAQVLEYILQRENRQVLCTNSDAALGLLCRVVQQEAPVTVLLDVGAQVLELQNEQVAREWLKLDSRPEIEAAVYFDPSSDEICVISRDGRIQPLSSSLYKAQLQRTLVYLDEAHTRGTDFKFPARSRAVVTLGPQLGKDKLVQGCMRMRRLGKDHSLLFFASKEIWTKIQTCTATQARVLDSSHVLLWTMQETCTQIRDNGSLWANQGLNFDARRTALSDGRPYSSLVDALQERESRTLEQLYGVNSSQAGNENQAAQVSQLQIEIQRKCAEFGIVLSHNALSEEQERELAHEKEDERELERIPGAKALDHRDDDLSDFIDTGVIRWPASLSFISLEDCLANTSWISSLPQGTLFRGQDLRATKDFRDTISLPPISSAGWMESYLRPVQWILSTSRSKTLVIVSPFEANKWLPAIRRSRFVSLHLYSPRISRNWSFESLDSFTVPRRRSQAPSRKLIHELNLFAGQLFCADKRSVKEVCGILSLHLQALNDREDLQGKMDRSGFVQDRGARAELGIDACAFTSTPLPFFRELFASRRKGQGFALTHMGQILRGNDPKDPDFEVDAA
ncbi:hypothetical protein B0H17DRAFT_1124601 [Mycena rosella]|uniref:ubiquitinyl hydrolase 1 n=1 Tax=Mycena rosella TaxID=1033263 RepID=A0AAD7MBC7_MYCRO|nr:hypothetical protein B0H17DRAFT_1124601 [Mycena rosella]